VVGGARGTPSTLSFCFSSSDNPQSAVLIEMSRRLLTRYVIPAGTSSGLEANVTLVCSVCSEPAVDVLHDIFFLARVGDSIELEGNWSILVRVPFCSSSLDDLFNLLSKEVPGLLVGTRGFIGMWFDIEVCGRVDCAEGARMELVLLANVLFDLE
jgi:hypothetical protein